MIPVVVATLEQVAAPQAEDNGSDTAAEQDQPQSGDEADRDDPVGVDSGQRTEGGEAGSSGEAASGSEPSDSAADATVDLTADQSADPADAPEVEPAEVEQRPADVAPGEAIGPVVDGDSTVDLTVDPAVLAEIRAAQRAGRPGTAPRWGWTDGVDRDRTLSRRTPGSPRSRAPRTPALGVVAARSVSRPPRDWTSPAASGLAVRVGFRTVVRGCDTATTSRSDDLLLDGCRGSRVHHGLDLGPVHGRCRQRLRRDGLHGGGLLRGRKRLAQDVLVHRLHPAGHWRTWPPSIRSGCASGLLQVR